jgi:hypothetical protein
VEVAARLAVLVACGVAAGALFVSFATPGRVLARSREPAPLAGLGPTVLGAFILLAGGTALTGAGTIDAGPTSALVEGAGTALLALAGLRVAWSAVRALRAATAAEAVAVESPSLLVLAWAGAALATASWILAAGTVVVALLAGVSVRHPG